MKTLLLLVIIVALYSDVQVNPTAIVIYQRPIEHRLMDERLYIRLSGLQVYLIEDQSHPDLITAAGKNFLSTMVPKTWALPAKCVGLRNVRRGIVGLESGIA